MTEPAQQLSRPAALKGIIFLLLVLFLTTISSGFFMKVLGIHKIDSTIFFISRLLFWIIAWLAWLYSIKIDKQKLLIWQEKKYSFLFYLLSVVIIYVVLIAGNIIIQHILLSSGLMKKSDLFSVVTNILKTNMPLLVFTCLTAGITEELIFRGFLQPRLEIVFKSPWVAIILSAFVFGLMHAKWGTIINVAVPVFIGIVFAFYYWRYRNIKVLIAFHFFWDLIILLISIRPH